MKYFIVILQFLTRIPININIQVTREDFQKGVIFFPVTGLIIGAFDAAVYYSSGLIFSGSSPVFLVVAAHAAITGGIHMDGLSDTADGIFSGRTKDRILEIMKDSRVGTFGALALIFLVLGKFTALSSVNKGQIISSLILAPVVARTLMTFMMYKRKYARDKEGMGDLFIGVLDRRNFLGAVIIGTVLVLIIGREKGLLVLGCCLIFTLLFRRYIEKQIGGITGDILGATVELDELLVYLIYAAMV
ncbi:MAG: adenosylcobinamide-GDP ribazoletransferase [Clostridiaceae bacterium]